MKNHIRLISVLLSVTALIAFATGCSAAGVSNSRFSQAQLNAIETRVIDAGMDASYNAASNALFDAGFTIVMSDRVGGLLTGRRSKSNRAARIWISPWIEDVDYTISIQIHENGPRQSLARIKIAINGEARVDKNAIDQIWTLMSRQVLMKTPPSIPSGRAG